ncbi:MAG: class I SAM-dependent DNA methyltransferase [Holophagaceae bacterium]|nr:class I SAM-dependent DNA methyltransferase [Holophagaceae bacterium]
MVIDFYGLTSEEAKRKFPGPYQYVFEHVKPERDQNRREPIRNNWWLFGWVREGLRASTKGQSRFIVTVETAKHRVFQFLGSEVRPDNMLTAFASDDAFHLGVLNSHVHVVWALAAGAAMGVGNTPRYSKTRCFEPFPFPEANEPQKAVIRDLAERLDAHRKAAQGRGATITGMYNLLVKLRSGEPFSDREREQHEIAQTEILRQLYDELDAAVADAYGWPVDLPDADILTNLVALNKERAAEEARGVVRWLRPEYQAPETLTTTTTALLPEATDFESVAPITPIEAQPWPKDLKDQLGAVRAVLTSSANLWSLESVAQAFKSRGRYRESIASHLDLLTDLGMLSRVGTREGPALAPTAGGWCLAMTPAEFRIFVQEVQDESRHWPGPMGQFQELRARIRGRRSAQSDIFRFGEKGSVYEGYAFHFGGRSEMQLNLGLEEDGAWLRYGLALSFEPKHEPAGPSGHAAPFGRPFK